jgi:hypothetical protein
MKAQIWVASTFLMGLLLAGYSAAAEVELPSDNNKEKWNEYLNTFAECSAVYNLAATVKTAPEQGTTGSYRELANNALISGIMSAEKLGLHDDYVESIYTTKYGIWQKVVNDKARRGQLLEKADLCVSTALPYQNLIIQSLRNQSSAY